MVLDKLGKKQGSDHRLNEVEKPSLRTFKGPGDDGGWPDLKKKRCLPCAFTLIGILSLLEKNLATC